MHRHSPHHQIHLISADGVSTRRPRSEIQAELRALGIPRRARQAIIADSKLRSLILGGFTS